MRDATDCTHRYKSQGNRYDGSEGTEIAKPLAIAAGCLFGFAAGQYLLAEAVAATMFDGYSYFQDTVSELGVPSSSPGHVVMNTAFYVSAVSVLAAGVCSVPLLGRGVRRRGYRGWGYRGWGYLAAIGAYSVGSVLVASVHAREGNAHVIGAVLAIGAGNVIAVLVGTGVPGCSAAFPSTRWYRTGSVGLGLAGFAASALLIAGIGPVGLTERLSIYTFTGWEVLTAVALLRRSASPSPEMPARPRRRRWIRKRARTAEPTS